MMGASPPKSCKFQPIQKRGVAIYLRNTANEQTANQRDQIMDYQNIPVIDLSTLLHQNFISNSPSSVIHEIGDACRTFGIFNVINHGVEDLVMEQALDANGAFFDMEMDAKQELVSDDIFAPVRMGKSEIIGDSGRDFLKLYAYPLHQFLSFWPTLPQNYREKMEAYGTQVRKLSIQLFGAILESLNIQSTGLRHSFEKGFHIFVTNCYSPSSESDAWKIGLQPHTDHSIITILLQSAPGLEVIDNKLTWKTVPELKGSLQVLVGDHLEVISNGLYKSVLHRAVPKCDGTRLSIGSFHNFEMDEQVEPAAELVGNHDSVRYKGSTLRDFLQHSASKDKKTFIEAIKN